MKKVEFKGLDQSYYTETLENGLQVYVIPYENKNQYHVSLVTKFGSDDTSFIPEGEKEMTTVPNGIAHFLEHKMFETEKAKIHLRFFQKLDATAMLIRVIPKLLTSCRELKVLKRTWITY